MNRVHVFKSLVSKDLALFLGDRRAWILSFAAPIVLASFMAMVLGGVGDGADERGQIAIGIVDLDHSATSRAIADALAEDEAISLSRVEHAAARESVKKGRLAVAVVLPEGLGENAARGMFGGGDRPVLTFYYDPTRAAELGMARGLIAQHAIRIITTSAFRGDNGRKNIRDAKSALANAKDVKVEDRVALMALFAGLDRWFDRAEAADKEADAATSPSLLSRGFQEPYETREESIASGGKAFDRVAIHAHAFAGMAVQFVLFAAIDAGVGLLTERKQGIWKRLRAAPLSKALLLGAKCASGAILAAITTLVILAFGGLTFRIPIFANPLGLIAVTVAFGLTASTLGLLIAAIGKTPAAARGVSILVVLIMVMLGGAWFPSTFMPKWVQQSTPAIPTRWAVDGLDGVLTRGYSPAEIGVTVLALLGFAAVFAALAFWRFRWDAE